MMSDENASSYILSVSTRLRHQSELSQLISTAQSIR